MTQKKPYLATALYRSGHPYAMFKANQYYGL